MPPGKAYLPEEWQICCKAQWKKGILQHRFPNDSKSQRIGHLEFGAVQEKLKLLDLDPVMEFLSDFYSHTGRPAKNQVQIIRSFTLMGMLGFTSLTNWVWKLILALTSPCISVF